MIESARYNVKEKNKKETPSNTERELGVFSMTSFDNTTSSFLALLVTKSYKLKVQNSEEKFPHNAVKKFFDSGFCHVTHLQDIKNFVGQ